VSISKPRKETNRRGSRIIYKAIQIFRNTGKRPSKSAIRRALEEQDGAATAEIVDDVFKDYEPAPWYLGKNAQDEWNKWFERLGLRDLPD
jgi:hypothetical protein